MASRVSLIEPRVVLLMFGLRSAESLVGAEPDGVVAVLEVLVAVLEHLPRLVLLLELRIIVGIKADLVEIPAEVRGIIVGRGHSFHVYLKQKEGSR